MPTPSQYKAEAEYRRCEADAEYFIRHYIYIKHPERGKLLFGRVFSEAQAEALAYLRAEKYSLFYKARQTGFTTLVMAYVLWFVLFHADKSVLVLSKREDDAIKNLGRAIYAYRWLPKWMKLRAGDGRNQARTDSSVATMTFLNGSVVDSLPATRDTGRGESASLTVLDEWAFFPDAEGTWTAIESAADVGGSICIISTANGFGNVFHKMWEKAARGDGLFKAHFYSWAALPQRDEAWYAGKAATLEPWHLNQEYPRTPEEGFIRSNRPYFDVDLVITWATRLPEARYVVDGEGLWSPRMDGDLRVWEDVNREHTYVMGADTAEGLLHGDFSSLHVLDVQTGRVVAVWHGRIDPDLFGARVLYSVGQHYNYALIGPERNASGLTTVTALVKAEYPYIYRQTLLDRMTQVMQEKFGWQTTRTSRPLMLDELEEAIREKSIECYDEGTRQELLAFVRDDQGRGSGSPHDDRVISLAITVQMLKWAHSPEYQREKVAYGTLAWYHERFVKPPTNDLKTVVGNQGLLLSRR